MPIWHQSPKLTPRYFLETPRLFGYPYCHYDNKPTYFPELPNFPAILSDSID